VIPKRFKASARGFNPEAPKIKKRRQGSQFGGARLPHGHRAFSQTAARTILRHFRVLHPPSRGHGVVASQVLALELSSIIWPSLVHHGYSHTQDRGSAAFRPFQLIRRANFSRLARPLRKFRSLAPPVLGLHRPLTYLSAYGLKPWAVLCCRFAAKTVPRHFAQATCIQVPPGQLGSPWPRKRGSEVQLLGTGSNLYKTENRFFPSRK
jgi:hypothetical protein